MDSESGICIDAGLALAQTTEYLGDISFDFGPQVIALDKGNRERSDKLANIVLLGWGFALAGLLWRLE